MSSNIQTSFTFQLGKESSFSVNAEVDGRSLEENGDNATRLGKTTDFAPGEQIGFLLYLPKDVEVLHIVSSLDDMQGKVSKIKTESISITEILRFTNTRQLTLSKPTTSVNSKIYTTWIGNNLGELILQEDQITVKLPPKKVTNTIQKPKIGLCEVSYNTQAILYRFNTPTKKSMEKIGPPPYPVEIYIVCEKKKK
ncbi:MAG TPA: hypothetical protein EYP59_09200 [Thiotrichaceae bacterium]|nr:hypothetical protein [Thiotrichaceae bacterium]